MTQQELKIRRQPLLKRYRQQPDNALIRFSAKGELGENGTFRIKDGDFFKETGLHTAIGGSGLHTWPGDMFLESLAACAGITLNTLASSAGITLKKAQVTAVGIIDFRGTLDMSSEVPVGFKSLSLKFTIESDTPESQIRNLISLTEEHCEIFQTLKNTPEIKVTLNYNTTQNRVY